MSRPGLLGTNWPTVTRFTGQPGLTGLQSNMPNGWYVPQIWTGLVMEKFWEHSILAKICNTDIEEPIKRGGGEAIIRKRPPVTTNDWIVNQDLVFDASTDDAITIPIKFARYAAKRIDAVDLAQMDLDFIDITAEDMNNQLMEDEMSDVISSLTTQIITALGTDAEYISAPGSGTIDRNKSSVYLDYTAVSTSRSSADYIVAQIAKMRTIFNRKRLPQAGRFLLVPPAIEEILILSDQATWNISGQQNKPVETGEYGLKVCGFDIIVSNFVTTQTFDPDAGGAAASFTGFCCLAGIKKGYAFARQVMDADFGFDLGYLSFGKGLKLLDVYGCGVSNWPATGILGLKIS